MEASVALQTVNNESRGSTACDIALVAFTDSKPIAACVIQGRLAAIVQIMVQAIGNGETWRTMPALLGTLSRSRGGPDHLTQSGAGKPSLPLGVSAANTYFVNACGSGAAPGGGGPPLWIRIVAVTAKARCI
jgi:hypothetical protein